MNKLKFEEQTFKVVDLDGMQTIINKVYNIDFSIPCDQECSNDIHLMFTVETGQNTDKYEKTAIKRLLDGKNETYMLGILLNDMCDKDIIPAGNYLINISW